MTLLFIDYDVTIVPLLFSSRLAVSHDDRGILAVPLDNRHIKLYDLKGSRLAHSSKNSRTVSLSLSLSYFTDHDTIYTHSNRVTIVWCTVLPGHLTIS